jgi:hypothetical protein
MLLRLDGLRLLDDIGAKLHLADAGVGLVATNVAIFAFPVFRLQGTSIALQGLGRSERDILDLPTLAYQVDELNTDGRMARCR